MAQYRKPQGRTVSATISKSATISASGGSRPGASRAPIQRPPNAEVEQPIYHPDTDIEAPEPEPNPDEDLDLEVPAGGEPEPVVTVGEEQLARSIEMEAMGVEEWKRQHDERQPEEQDRAVEGVGSLEQ